ncbi:Predicted phosphatase/phosphohexomutase of HAD family [Prochlorococcus marinus subsp. marinus str. CCMP1375]|uniref:Predicted phosphatase/phosphohexomutase of HAD family n=1 Tax=Prochlorococcus marinus (strain SARG / CCMP1375 / SS120) TaxID=167539 RepID=Q7VBV9_PROMA|nr:HAD family hydrolase [Prochlorococcus marinus]AAQ00028.1 Predicted phosphatase/phosphohexomutase of HAD family [Prochlorococcus marinus subsp. marinus str. CCMP1375]
MEALNTVFWDLDGTIANTEMSGHRIAFNLAFSEYSLMWNWDEELYIRLLSIGGGLSRIIKYFEEINTYLSLEQAKLIHKRKQFHYNSLVSAGKLDLRIGVSRLINELYSKNVKQWIVTTSSILAVNAILNRYFPNHKLLFSGIISGEDVNCHKPDSEAYDLALKRSNSLPQNSLAIEDSIIGCQAAKSAQLKCIMTLSPWIKSAPRSTPHADLVVDHLGDNHMSSKIFYGHTKESMINYSCLYSILNGKI